MSVIIERVGFAPNYVNYAESLDEQRRIHAEVAERTRNNTILLLEHEAVITAGKRYNPNTLGGRGGRIT